MKAKPEKRQADKPVDSKKEEEGSHHRKFIWNWRMLVLGLLLNAATLGLVLYTVSLLNEYRRCAAASGFRSRQARRAWCAQAAVQGSFDDLESQELIDLPRMEVVV